MTLGLLKWAIDIAEDLRPRLESFTAEQQLCVRNVSLDHNSQHSLDFFFLNNALHQGRPPRPAEAKPSFVLSLWGFIILQEWSQMKASAISLTLVLVRTCFRKLNGTCQEHDGHRSGAYVNGFSDYGYMMRTKSELISDCMSHLLLTLVDKEEPPSVSIVLLETDRWWWRREK